MECCRNFSLPPTPAITVITTVNLRGLALWNLFSKHNIILPTWDYSLWSNIPCVTRHLVSLLKLGFGSGSAWLPSSDMSLSRLNMTSFAPIFMSYTFTNYVVLVSVILDIFPQIFIWVFSIVCIPIRLTVRDRLATWNNGRLNPFFILCLNILYTYSITIFRGKTFTLSKRTIQRIFGHARACPNKGTKCG